MLRVRVLPRQFSQTYDQELIGAIEREVVSELHSKLNKIESSNSILLKHFSLDSIETINTTMCEALEHYRGFTHVMVNPVTLSFLQLNTGNDFSYKQDEISSFSLLTGPTRVGCIYGGEVEVILSIMIEDSILFFSQDDIIIQIGEIEISDDGVVFHYKTYLRK